MKRFMLLALILSVNAFAEGYYYPIPQNPPPIQYSLPPAYITPQQPFIPPPVYIQPIQRGYFPPPPEGWANSKVVPLPPPTNLYQQK